MQYVLYFSLDLITVTFLLQTNQKAAVFTYQTYQTSEVQPIAENTSSFLKWTFFETNMFFFQIFRKTFLLLGIKDERYFQETLSYNNFPEIFMIKIQFKCSCTYTYTVYTTALS